MAGESLIGNLAVLLSMDTAAFEKGNSHAQKLLARTQKQFAALGKKMTSIGKGMTVGLTLPLAGFGALAVKEATEAQHAMGQVQAALKSMGPVAGRTAEQLKSAADAMELNSLYEGDEILTKVTANLLTFGKVSGEVFDRAQQSALDLATRLGGDIQSAALMLGKALNDPVKGLTALQKAGVKLEPSQKAMIANLVKSGQMAKAQGIILGEVERQVRGSAKAAADADPWHKATVAWKQMAETVGVQLLPLIPPLTNAIKSIAEAFGRLTPQTQKWLIITGGIAAVMGPALIGIGALVGGVGKLLPLFVQLGALFPAFGAGAAVVGAEAAAGAAGVGALGTAAGVVGAEAAVGATGLGALGAALLPLLAPLAAVAAVAGAVYLAWKNWDSIAPVLAGLWSAVSSALGPPLLDLLNAAKAVLVALWEGPLGTYIKVVIDVISNLGAIVAQVIGTVVVGVFKAAADLIGGAIKIIADALKVVAALLSGDFSGAWHAAKNLVFHFAETVGKVLGGLADTAIAAVSKLFNGVKTWLVDRLGVVLNWVRDKIQWVGDKFAWLYDVVVGHSYIPDMVSGIATEMGRLDSVMVQPAIEASDQVAAAFRGMSQEVRTLLDRLFPEQEAWRKFVAEDRLLGNVKDPKVRDEAKRRLRVEDLDGTPFSEDSLPTWLTDSDELGTWENVFGRPEMGDLKDVLDEKMVVPAQRSTAAVVESFADMAQGVASSLRDMVTAFKKGDILGGIQQMLNAVSQIVSAIRQIKNPNGSGGQNAGDGVEFRAKGGPVLPGRNYVVGENGPEFFTTRRPGYIMPSRGANMPAASQIMVVPSPYFDAVVDGRVVQRAAPMAGQAAAIGSAQAQANIVRRGRRRIP